MQLLHYYEPPIPAMGTGSQYCLRWNNHRTNLLSAFENLLRQEAFTDVTLACEEGVTLHAHRLVLAACSSYFSALFATAHSTQHPIVVLKDVKADDMRALLAYMYRGEVNVEQSALGGLLKVAEGLKVKGLVEDLAADAHPIPLLTHPSEGGHPPKNGLGVSSPPVTPGDQRVTSTGLEKKESEPPYLMPSRPICSPPPLSLPLPMAQTHSSPKRGISESPKHESPHAKLLQSPPHRSFLPTPYYPRLPHHLEQRPPPSLLDVKDINREMLEVRDRTEKVDRPPRPASDDPRTDRRPSPMPLLNSFPTHLSGHESPPAKRSRPFIGEPLISPTPILRTALAPFNPEVSSLVSLANSMMPLSPLLSSRPSPSILPQELPRRPIELRDPIEPPSYSLMPPKKREPLSDDESRHMPEIKEEELTERERPANVPIVADFPSYPLESNPPSSHYSNFVSYVPTPKPEWKRYKQYTKTDLMEAIECVRSGMTALQASKKYKVPSRTLYDKIKKMGITTIPRKLPSKRPHQEGDGALESPSMDSRPHSAGPFEHISSSRDYFDHRPCSMEAQSEPSLLPSLPIRSSSDSEGAKSEARKLSERSPPSGHEDPHQETSTRGSFSLVGRKVFASGETSPLDLTEHEGLIHSRQQLEERA